MQAFFLATLSPSIAIMNKNDESGSPCRTPREIMNKNSESQSLCRTPQEIENSLIGEPFTSTDAQKEERHPLICFRHFPPKHI